MEKDADQIQRRLIAVINKLILVIIVLVVCLIAMPLVFYYQTQPGKTPVNKNNFLSAAAPSKDTVTYWTPPDLNEITDAKQKEQAAYGKELIVHTSKYFGPSGLILKITNGLNCQNCHPQAGTAVYGNNFSAVAPLYPKFRARSGTVENVYKRINDCFERSLNGKAIDTAGKEMQAIAAYINFIGSDVPRGQMAAGSGLPDLAWLDRAADPLKGQAVYAAKCRSCHQAGGEGVPDTGKTEYIYPALWGNSSFNDGAGLYRISSFAKYIKYNMPQGTTFKNPQLTDEEAWDVAAFVVSQKRPHMNVPNDWPDKTKKPVDYPFGPYADNFSAQQHKFGPFKPIVAAGVKK